MTRTARRHSLTSALTVILSVMVAVSLVGCASIPTTSDVSSQEISVPDSAMVFYQSTGPRQGASPREIVSGFLAAQATRMTDNLAAANQYLTPDAQSSWNPDGDITVYTGELKLDLEGVGEDNAQEHEFALDDAQAVTIKLGTNALATVDTKGVYTEALAESTYETTFDLVRTVEGEWRISDLRDGMLLSAPLFKSNFRSISLYFASPDSKYLIPDVRWVWVARAQTYAIQHLLDGPAPWLKESVVSAFPEGARLLYDSVTNENGKAVVNLTKQIYNASAYERGVLMAQIETTLRGIPGVRTVELQANSVPLKANTRPTLIKDPSPAVGRATDPVVLSAGKLAYLRGKSITPVDGLEALDGFDVTALATSQNIVDGVFRDKKTSIRTFAKTGGMTGSSSGEKPTIASSSRRLMTGRALVAPSIDTYSWVWSAEEQAHSSTPMLKVAARFTEGRADVPVPWLAGRSIVALRVSHDGMRIVIVSRANGTTHIEVAGIIRDEMLAPVSISAPVTVAGQVEEAADVQWLDESTLWVTGSSATSDAVSLYTAQVAGASEFVAPAEDVATMSSARGLRGIVVGTKSGTIRTRGTTGTSWTEVAVDARFPTYPG